MATDDGAAYVYENVGFNTTSTNVGVAYVYEDVQVGDQSFGRSVDAVTTSGLNDLSGVAYVYENVT